MSRTILVLCALLLFLGGLTDVNAMRLPPEVLIAPGATDIRVVETSWEQQLIVYRVTELPSAWMDLVGKRLEARGWLRIHSGSPYMAAHTYRHVAVAGPFTLVQDAVLQSIGSEAHISNRTQLVFVRWRLSLESHDSAQGH
ncbi:MAG: hypothetical protein DIU80_012800 [Chloroflexota bacterium]